MKSSCVRVLARAGYELLDADGRRAVLKFQTAIMYGHQCGKKGPRRDDRYQAGPKWRATSAANGTAYFFWLRAEGTKPCLITKPDHAYYYRWDIILYVITGSIAAHTLVGVPYRLQILVYILLWSIN